MPSITTWQRLEPRTRTTTLSAVRARVHDPAWLLARQRQLAEWQGEDTGSAIRADVAGHSSRLTRYRPGPAAGGAPATPYPAEAPLEAVVEAETGARAATAGPLFAARSGQCFLRSLHPAIAARYRAEYVTRYRLNPPAAAIIEGLDDASRRLLDVLVGHVPDGHALYAELDATVRPSNGAPSLPAQPTIDNEDTAAVLTAAQAWLDWFDTMHPAPRSQAWSPEQLEHVFSIGAPRPAATGNAAITLTAPGFADGHLDWYAFDTDATVTLGAAGAVDSWTATAIPTPVRFPGMPNPRWWEFEDGATNFGSIDAAPDDLGRLALLEFALVYGNDFLHVPIDLPVGSLCWIDRLTVRNTFGETVEVKSVEQADGADGRWSMFRNSGPDGSRGDFLFLAPTVHSSLHGVPIEQILLMRDEVANVAWAVEQRVQTQAGTSAIPREIADDTRARTPQGPETPVPDDPNLIYRLATDVPDHWHPLLPVTIARSLAGTSWTNVALELSGLHEVGGDILRPTTAAPRRIAEQAIPRSGVVLTRAWQRTRWIDGSIHMWVERRKRSGRGEGSSGLRYDAVDLEGATDPS